MFILSAFKLRRVFSSLAQRSGKGIFNTAGIAYLIGAVLVGAHIASGGVRLSIGGLIISIAWILAAVAFLSAKFQPHAQAPPPSA